MIKYDYSTFLKLGKIHSEQFIDNFTIKQTIIINDYRVIAFLNQDRQLHNINGPAFVVFKGDEKVYACFFINGLKHARNWAERFFLQDKKYYYWNGNQITREQSIKLRQGKLGAFVNSNNSFAPLTKLSLQNQQNTNESILIKGKSKNAR